ncbi:hypothetical protein F0U59_21860 [Archangium gephyra]|nr:hypothetical protein F0U59_21860 [Archangium gephyra]
MWTRYVVAALTLGLWACGPSEPGEEVWRDEGRVGLELVQQVGPLQQARYQHSSTKLLNGKVLYAGGGTGNSAPILASVELYDPATGTTALVAPMNTARRSHTAVLLQDGSVLVVGGISSTSVIASAERYEPSTNTWTVVAPMPRASYGHSATLLADGRVLVAGGVSYYTPTYLFDPAANTWTTTGSLALGRMRAASLRLPDNRVLMMGGTTAATADRTTVELYDPATGTWSSRSRFPSSNGGPSAVLLPNGRVLLNGQGTTPVEYDVAADTWTQKPSFNRYHGSATLVLVGGAPVVIGGGFDEPSIERFNASLNQWELVGALSITRNDITVDVLSNDSVVIAGGSQTNTYVPYATMDLFSYACVPLTCSTAGAQCGALSDGCGGTLQCGTCTAGYTCNSSNQCTAPDFTLTATVSSRTVAKGGWARYPITTSGSTSGGAPIHLSISGQMPSGSGAYFGSMDIAAGNSTFLEVQTSETFSAAGRYTLTVTGTDGVRTHTTTVTLLVTSAAGTDPIVNGGFETGSLSGWSSTGDVAAGPGAHSGSYTAVLGLATTPLAGDSKLSQTFTVPANGALLRYWLFGHAVDAPSDYASVLLTDNTTGTTTALIAQTYARPPYQDWLDISHDLTPYAGRSVTLTFVNHEAGWGSPTYTYIDDVSLLVPGDFTVSLSPSSQSAQAGRAVSYTVTTQGQGTLSLAAVGLPSGVTATFSPSTVTAGQSSTLTLSTTSSTAMGSYAFTVEGTDTSIQVRRSASAQLSVTAPPPPPGGSFTYSATNTNSAQQNTTNYNVYLTAGQTLKVGTCMVTGSSGTGDTYLRLYGVTATQVAYNDDSCGALSYLSYTATTSGSYQIRAGCYSTGGCSGTVAYTIQ